MPPEPPLDTSDNCLPCDGETIIALGSDDSDDEVEPDNVVYTLLGQQEPTDGSSSTEEDEEDDDEADLPFEALNNMDVSHGEAHAGNLPPAPRPSGSEEIASVWNSCPPTASLSLNAEKAAEIQAAMANFTLPPSAVPAWAANIPEEQWKQGLLERLQRGNLRLSKNSSVSSNNNNNNN